MGSTPDDVVRAPAQPEPSPSQHPPSQRPKPRIAYSVQDAAEILGLSADTVYELVRGNKLPHKRIGRRILIPSRGLETWLNAQDAWASFDGS